MKPILYFTKKIHAYAGKILYLNLLGMMFVSLLEGAGLLLLLPLLGVIGIAPQGTARLDSLVQFQVLKDMPPSGSLLVIFGAYAALIVGQSLLQRNLTLRDTKLHAGFVNHVRLETYRALLQADWQFFIKRRQSDLLNAMTDELGRVTSGTYMVLQFLASLAFTLIQLAIAFWLSPPLTLFVLACGLLIAFISRIYIRRAGRLGIQTSELARSYVGHVTDHLSGIKDIKSNMLEASRLRWLQQWCKDIWDERVAHTRNRMNSQLIYKSSAALVIAAFIYASVVLFATSGAKLLLIVLVVSRMWPRFIALQGNLEQIAAAAPAFRSLVELQTASLAARESIAELDLASDVRPLELKSALECRQVSFRYDRADDLYALRDVSLRIEPRRMTAVVGRSGAGKSTLIDILMGLLQPEDGQVLADGVPVTDDRLLALRKSIGYVPQDPLLFNGTIRDNLLLVAPEASEERLWEALDFAAADAFVKRLPQGLDSTIGDRGVRLSGGERQRLVLARAMLRNPSILVLDEATSALDTENEARIQEALARLKGRTTLIVIAHRMSTIRGADQVVVLDRGEVVQTGSYQQLAVERSGLFARLVGDQAKEPNRIA